MYTKIYQCLGKQLPLERTFHKVNQNDSTAYPTIPGTIDILDTTYKRNRKRPVGYVQFRYAKLCTSYKDVYLCDDKNILYPKE